MSVDPEPGARAFYRSNCFDKEARRQGGKDKNLKLGRAYSADELLDFVTSINRVLITRGVKGTDVRVERDLLKAEFRNRLNPAIEPMNQRSVVT